MTLTVFWGPKCAPVGGEPPKQAHPHSLAVFKIAVDVPNLSLTNQARPQSAAHALYVGLSCFVLLHKPLHFKFAIFVI